MTSQDVVPLITVGGTIALLVGLVLSATVGERRRTRALAGFALARGFTFSQERPAGALLAPTISHVFNRGHSRHWRNELRGTLGGRDFVAAEYRFTTGSGRSSATFNYAVVLWPAPGLPRFDCVPETFVERLAEAFGGTDFDFTEDPEFSRAYRLRGTDEAAVRAAFDGGRRALLVAQRGTHLAAGNGFLAWWQPRRLPAPDKLDEFLGAGDALARAFGAGAPAAG